MEWSGEIRLEDLARLLDCDVLHFPKECNQRIAAFSTRYRPPVQWEVETYTLQMLRFIEDPHLRREREENLRVWEKGWNENLSQFEAGAAEQCLIPKYFRPSNFFRLDKGIIVPENSNLEYDLFSLVRLYIFHRFFANFSSFYELGCGSCQNLVVLARLFSEKMIHGLDWTKASQSICQLLNERISPMIKGRNFDMTAPDDSLLFAENSMVFSIHALEQLGAHHEKLLSFLIRKRPAMVFHYEPVLEFYDTNNLYDYLALHYSKRRNYLSGFLTALRELEAKGRIEILLAHRPGIGGIYHESSFILWRPIA